MCGGDKGVLKEIDRDRRGAERDKERNGDSPLDVQ